MLDRAYGCLIGSAIGDAMGMPASFMTPEEIKRNYGKIVDFNKPTEEQVAHGMLEEGEITDDTEESLVISSVLIECGKFDRNVFIDKMREWAVKNNMLETTVIGPSTRKFLETIINYGDYIEAGKRGDTNGGAMRVAPIGIFHHGNLKEAVFAAGESAVVSHGSKPGMASTCAVAGAISLAVEGKSTLKEVMEGALYGARFGEEMGYSIPAPSVYDRIKLCMRIVDENRGDSLEEICLKLYRIIGAGMKSYESIPLSLGIFYAAKGIYEDGLISAINVGDDADTNGAIVGALCGSFSGAGLIKKEWIDYVETRNKIDFREIAGKLISKL